MSQKPITEQANEFIDGVLEHAEDELGTAGKQMDDLSRDIRSTASRVADSAGATWRDLRKQVRQNPEASLFVGAFLGFAIGFLMRGRD